MKRNMVRQPASVYVDLLEGNGQISMLTRQLIDNEDIDIYASNLLRDIFSAVIRNNWSVQVILRKYQETKDYQVTNRQRLAAKDFISTVDFGTILASAVRGQDHGGRAADFANLIVVIAASDEAIAYFIAKLIRDMGYQPFDYDGDYLEG